MESSMTKEEYYRLRGFWEAKRNRPTWNGLAKRHIRGKAAGVGQILKRSYIKPLVSLERVFPKL